MKCWLCEKEFAPRTIKAKYCSRRCSVIASRGPQSRNGTDTRPKGVKEKLAKNFDIPQSDVNLFPGNNFSDMHHFMKDERPKRVWDY